MLGARPEASLDETARDYIRRMQGAAARMQTLLNSLLAYSRVITKAERIKVTDLGKSVEEALSNLEIMLEEKNAHMKLCSLPTVWADWVRDGSALPEPDRECLEIPSGRSTPVLEDLCTDGGNQSRTCDILIKDNGMVVKSLPRASWARDPLLW
jgi:signal transduction histidine kinase